MFAFIPFCDEQLSVYVDGRLVSSQLQKVGSSDNYPIFLYCNLTTIAVLCGNINLRGLFIGYSYNSVSQRLVTDGTWTTAINITLTTDNWFSPNFDDSAWPLATAGLMTPWNYSGFHNTPSQIQAADPSTFFIVNQNPPDYVYGNSPHTDVTYRQEWGQQINYRRMSLDIMA
jgi:hypothetical protein